MVLAALEEPVWAADVAAEERELRTLLAELWTLVAELETIEAELDSEAMELLWVAEAVASDEAIPAEIRL